MNPSDAAKQSANIIQSKKPNFKPTLAIVLGSGLSNFCDAMEDKTTVPYEELVNFPVIEVEGHGNNVILGTLNGVNLICLQGRSHKYEHISDSYVLTYVRTARLLGADYFIASNASGSLNQDVPPGSLVQITDHINFQGSSPLLGKNDDEFGPRFPPMDNAYDPTFNKLIHTEADKLNIPLKKGVYISVLGPNYETAAEIRMFKLMGADVIGMSTVPEVIVANHCGFKVAVVATITNFATGLEGCVHDHDVVVKTANQNAEQLKELLTNVVANLPKATEG
jgi:xanthosine phosphorylase